LKFSDNTIKIFIHRRLLMKIYSKFIFPINFTTESVTSKREKSLFEEYFKIALSEIEKKEFLEKTQKERINLVY